MRGGNFLPAGDASRKIPAVCKRLYVADLCESANKILWSSL